MVELRWIRRKRGFWSCDELVLQVCYQMTEDSWSDWEDVRLEEKEDG